MTPPTILDAPGLKWRPIKAGWQAIWRARSDLMKRGYSYKYLKLWESTENEREPSSINADIIARKCRDLQDDMLIWAGGGLLELGTYDGTWSSLIRCYKTDPDSKYRAKKIRAVTRAHYDTLCRRIEKDCGKERIADTDTRRLLRLHEGWSDFGKKPTMGHGMIGMMRTLTTFGANLLKCPACKALRPELHDMRIESGKARDVHLTAGNATAIRKHSPRHSIALAQAFQFDGTMRQKDIIGEWVPIDEPGPLSYIIQGNDKWIRGLLWEEIDGDFILRHVTSKKNKLLTLDLKLCPMVMEELRVKAGVGPLDALDRQQLPGKGPIIVHEATSKPWDAGNFRKEWRKVARACGIPDNIRNMDTRSGAITEALAAGAAMDDVRKSATHSNASMTARYSRGDAEAVANVLVLRAKSRNKP